MRTQDAVPDEVEVIPEGARRKSQSGQGSEDTSATPGGTNTQAHPDIPTTVVSKVDGEPSLGEVPGTAAYAKRQQDAGPDVVVETGDVPGMTDLTFISASSEPLTDSESPTASSHRSSSRTTHQQGWTSSGFPAIADDGGFGPIHYEETVDEQGPDEDEFGDDFDDFEEGQGNEEFGAFDEGAQRSSADSIQIKNDVRTAQQPPSRVPSFVSSYYRSNTFWMRRKRLPATTLNQGLMVVGIGNT